MINSASGRRLSLADKLIGNLDTIVKTLSPGTASASRPCPASDNSDAPLSQASREHIAGLMRINHTGEVCAQALYQGQAVTARLDKVRISMEAAAAEEIDHLAWCEQRLRELDSHPSLLNPLFYAASFSIGALAGAVSDKISLGFVAATEEQVCKHLQSHLGQIPPEDHKTRAILQQMLADEGEHATHAISAGGHLFPEQVKQAMSALSKVMTESTYRV